MNLKQHGVKREGVDRRKGEVRQEGVERRENNTYFRIIILLEYEITAQFEQPGRLFYVFLQNFIYIIICVHLRIDSDEGTYAISTHASLNERNIFEKLFHCGNFALRKFCVQITKVCHV